MMMMMMMVMATTTTYIVLCTAFVCEQISSSLFNAIIIIAIIIWRSVDHGTQIRGTDISDLEAIGMELAEPKHDVSRHCGMY